VGYYGLNDLLFLTGLPEAALRAEMKRLGISVEQRFGKEAINESSARKLMGNVKQLSMVAADDVQPGYALARLKVLMDRAIAATNLNLSGLNILTEAASGAYATTPIIAAMAGAARVYALARPTRYGSVEEVAARISQLASFVGVADRVTVIETIAPQLLPTVDIVTNSGHLRPLTADHINRLPERAVIALMFEAWEYRPGDLDLDACVRQGIPVVGVNERHPAVDVFSYLGPLCVRQLHDCGLAVYGNRIALLCDNDFADSIFRALSGMGARVKLFASVDDVFPDEWDAIVVALQPSSEPRIGEAEARRLADVSPPGVAITQFWGDIDRTALRAHGMAVWPKAGPAPGHMGALLSAIGPEPIVRLQTGGLRAAEQIFRGEGELPEGFAQLVRPT
jgi:hypothetical protein